MNGLKRGVIPLCLIILSGTGPAPQTGGGTIVGVIEGPVDFSVTPATGVPPEEYTLNIWHPNFDDKTATIVVEEGRTVNVKVTLQ